MLGNMGILGKLSKYHSVPSPFLLLDFLLAALLFPAFSAFLSGTLSMQ
jgi:hypothetical protein